MPDPYAPEGILPNVLRWIDRPGQAVRNLLRGNEGAAGRQALDFLTEPVDAAIPFWDAIPEATTRQDYVSGSELVGIDQNNAVGRTAADIGVGIATDPLTYLSFGMVPMAKGLANAGKYTIEAGIPFTGGAGRKALGYFDQAVDPLSLITRGADAGIKKGISAVDKLTNTGTVAGKQSSNLQAYEGLKAGMRRAVGAEDISDPMRKIMQEGTALGSASSKVWTGQVEGLIKGLTKEERVLLGQAAHGVDLGTLKPGAQVTAVPLGNDFIQNIDVLAQQHGLDATKLKSIGDSISEIGQRQYDEAVGKGAMYLTPGQNQQYMARQWYLEAEDAAKPGLPNTLKERNLTTPEKVAKFLNDNQSTVGLELDAGRLMLNRAQQQGRMLEQAHVATSVGGVGTLAKDLKTSASEAIDQMPNLARDDSAALKRAISGMPPRQGMFKALRAVMPSPVKGAMVYGVVLPKFGSLLRNKIGMGLQAAATPGVREQAMAHLRPDKILSEMGKAWDEAYGTAMFGKADDLSKDMQLVEQAFAGAKQTDDVGRALTAAGRTDLADAVKHGVLDGFVSTEEILTKAGRDPKWQKFWDIYEAPGRMFQALEQRGRLMTFKNLKAAGKSPEEAAKLTKDALYDYRINAPENRNLRDVLPFGQFMAKAIPQSAKWMSTRPVAAVGAAPLFYDASGEEGPVYPYMQGRSRVSAGLDENGNPLYLTGFGLPMEAIDTIPNLSGGFREAGRDVSQGLLSSTSPVLKTGAAWVTGKDPFFGTSWGSYDKIPMVGNAGAAGRAYNMVAGTGALEPFGGGILRQLGQATDSSKPAGYRALDLTTGAKLVSVDPDIAQQKVITQYLEGRPDVQQYRTFYQQDKDPEFTSLMGELRAAKQRVKEKKIAAEQAGL